MNDIGARSKSRDSRSTLDNRTSDKVFLGFCTLLFGASAAVTIAESVSMASMHEMQMPGGWTMSMLWMLMPGQTWFSAAASFLGMWLTMMAAMMLPSLVPALCRYREAVRDSVTHRLGWMTAVAGAGYFFVWIIIGMLVYPLGIAVATATMQLPALASTVPTVTGVIFLVVGLLQFTRWKAQQLACCQGAAVPAYSMAANSRAAWHHGIRLGLHCSCCCAGLMAILFIIGLMDLRAMAVVTTAITVERITPAGEHVARAIGAVLIGAGLILFMRTVTVA